MRPTSASRLAAGVLAVVVVLTVASLPREAAPGYLVVLVGAVGVVGMLVAVRLWCRTCLGARVSAILLSSAVVVGQFLGAIVGGPAGEGAGWDFAAAGVVGLAVLVILLITVDARAVRPPVTERPPYAL